MCTVMYKLLATTVEPPNKGQVGTSTLFHYLEVSFIGGFWSKSLLCVLYVTLISLFNALKLMIMIMDKITHVCIVIQQQLPSYNSKSQRLHVFTNYVYVLSVYRDT